MGLYGFKRRFTPAILSGVKKHTIRGPRKYPDRPGDRMFLYEALRTKHTKKIAQVECSKVEPIRITETLLHRLVRVGGELLNTDECDQLAKCDGFESFEAMMAFWNGRLPFDGFIFHWKSISPQENTEWLKRKTIRRRRGTGQVSRGNPHPLGRDRSRTSRRPKKTK